MKQSSESHGVYTFGPFTLDADERVLLRDGRIVRLPAKTLSTLLVLVRNSKHLVEKEVLMNEVWPDEFVEEGNLTQHIFTLRKTLGETDSHKYIETVPRRGYRFLGAVAAYDNHLHQSDPPVSKRHTENSLAYESYLKGRYYWSKHTSAGIAEAITWFRRAIHLDPGYSLAYAGIIDCYLRLATNYLPPTDDPPKSTAEVAALEFDDGLLLAQPTLKIRHEWDRKSAERESIRASELKTNYPAAHQWYAAYVFARELYHNRAAVNPEIMADVRHEPTTSSDANVFDNIQSSRPTPAEELQIFCIVAREQIEAGNYEAGCEVLKRWWTMGEWPKLDGLSPHSSADLLFTVGFLAGNIASTRQVPRGQKHAEALLNGSIALFDQVMAKKRAAEGRIELGLCYQREGLFDLARAALQAALADLPDAELVLRSFCLMRIATLEHVSARYRYGLERLDEAAAIVKAAGPWITGRYVLELGSTLKNLAVAENNPEYSHRALEHYAESLYQFEAIGHHRLAAIAENNYGYLLLILNRPGEAEPHLIRARRLFEGLDDKVRSAQVDETTAQLYLITQQYELAEEVIRRSVETLELGGETSVLTESLRTQGVIFWRLGNYQKAQSVLDRAEQVSEHNGDVEGADRARRIKVEVIEQLSEELKRSEQRLVALENDATARGAIKDLAEEMRQVMTDSKALLDQLMGINGSGPQTASLPSRALQTGAKRIAISDEKLVGTIETLNKVMARGIEISQQMIDLSTAES